MSVGATLISSTGLSAFFKNRYPQRKIDNLVKFDKPTLSAIKTEDSLDGNITYVPVELDSPQGISGHLSKAIANASGSVGIAWQIQSVDLYAALTIDAKTMMAGRKDEGSFFRTRGHEFERILEQMGQHNEKMLWGNGSGSLGIVTAKSGETFTVAAASAINFHEGMVVRFYDELADASLPDSADEHATAGPYTVTGVNYGTGVITTSGTPALNADVVVNDHVLRDGTIDLMFKGIPSWIPATDPSATLFLGVNRSLHPQKLAGFRGLWKGTIEESVKALDATLRTFNQKGRTLWLSYANFNRLDLELGVRGYRDEEKGEGSFGRMTLKMTTPGGGCVVKAAPYLADDAGFLLDMDTWKICTLGGFPHLVQDDGLAATRLQPASGATATNDGDGIEIRIRQYAQTLCTNPFSNGRFPIV